MTPPSDAFLIADCETCDRLVLTARDLDASGRVILVCVHCESPIDHRTAKPANADRLEELGYAFEGRSDPHGERGCRDGACGVTQPDA